MPEPNTKFPWGDEDRRKAENEADRKKFQRHLEVALRAIELDRKKRQEVGKAEPEKVNLLDW